MLKIYSPIYFIIQILTVPRWRCVFLVLQREYVCMLVCVLCVLKKKKKKDEGRNKKLCGAGVTFHVCHQTLPAAAPPLNRDIV